MKTAEAVALRYVNMVEPLTMGAADKGLPSVLGKYMYVVRPCEETTLTDWTLLPWCFMNNLGTPDYQFFGNNKLSYVNKIKNSHILNPSKSSNFDYRAKIYVSTTVYTNDSTKAIYRTKNRILLLENINNRWVVTSQTFV